MRIDDLLKRHNNETMTQRQYERLKDRPGIGFNIIFYDPKTGWDTTELDELTESEARQQLATEWKLQAYEQTHNIDTDRVFSIIIQIHHTKEEQEPEWPPELQSYDANSFVEAYLCHKFDIELYG